MTWDGFKRGKFWRRKKAKENEKKKKIERKIGKIGSTCGKTP
jgi:hypothetical protein